MALKVRVGRGITQAEAAWHVRWAAAWWRDHGVSWTVPEWSFVSPEPIFGGDGTGGLKSVAAPLKQRMHAIAVPAGAEVQLVFLPTLASPDSPARRSFDRLAGFSLSGPLAERDATSGASAIVRDVLRLEQPFTPTVFLGMDALNELPQERARFVLAHELGHALGLPHDGASFNLMGPGFPRCAPMLSREQWQSLEFPGTQGHD